MVPGWNLNLAILAVLTELINLDLIWACKLRPSFFSAMLCLPNFFQRTLAGERIGGYDVNGTAHVNVNANRDGALLLAYLPLSAQLSPSSKLLAASLFKPSSSPTSILLPLFISPPHTTPHILTHSTRNSHEFPPSHEQTPRQTKLPIHYPKKSDTMTKGESTQSKVHYKGNNDDFIVFVDDVEAYKKWLGDSSVPLAHFVSSFKVFVTHK